MPLTRAEIQSFTRKTKDVKVEGLGEFRLAEPSAGLVADVFDGAPLNRAKSLKLLSQCLVDENGARIFDGPKAIDDVGREVPGRAFQPMIAAIVELAGFGDELEDDENPSEAGE